MPATPLTDRQFDLDGYTFGHLATSGVIVTDVQFAGAEARSNDVERPRADGVRFGREWRSGRTITVELEALDRSEAVLDELSRLCKFWDAQAIRSSPGSLSTLRWNLGGRSRRVLGRARRFDADPTYYRKGRVAVTATFDTEGPYYYDDDPAETTVGMSSPSTGGFTFPMVFPAYTTGMGERRSGIRVSGDVPAPLVLTINGPIAQPIVEVPGLWSFQLLDEILSDQRAIIDTRPWSMSAYRGPVNVAGRISVDSPRLPEMWLPPGTHDIVLRGQDPTGTASLSVQAWSTYASF